MTLQGPGKIVQGSKYAMPILNSSAIWWEFLSEFAALKLYPSGMFFRSTFQTVQGRRFQAAHPEHSQRGGYSKKIKKQLKTCFFRIPMATIRRKPFYRIR